MSVPTVKFVPRQNGPERLICEGAVHFGDEGPLAGLKLVGFSLWRSAEGEIYVTVPARSYGEGGEHRFFDLLRAVEGEGEAGTLRRFKQWVLDSYHGQATTALVDEYEEWMEREGLKLGSADEHLFDEGLTEAQRDWLVAFVERWDGRV